MPAFPKNVQSVLELARNINCLPKSLVGVIEKDPVMMMKILRVINGARHLRCGDRDGAACRCETAGMYTP